MTKPTIPIETETLTHEGMMGRIASLSEAVEHVIFPQGAKILVVEDDAVCALALSRLLEELGAHATIATTAREAMADLHQGGYAVMLLDIGLPDRDGLAFLRELQQKNIRIPVVAMTAYEWDQDQYHRAGFNGYLKKPIYKERLKHVLFRVLADPPTASTPP